MTPRSAKNKGQRASKELRNSLLLVFNDLEPDDIRVTPSGVPGPDILLSPKARSVIGNFDIEVKNQEKLSIWAAMDQVRTRSQNKTPLLVFRRNNEAPNVCLNLMDFLYLLKGLSCTPTAR